MQEVISTQHLFLNPDELNSVLHTKTWFKKKKIKKEKKERTKEKAEGNHKVDRL